MSVVSDFRNEFKRFGTYDPGSEKYTDGAAYKFDQACQHAKVDVDEILADLIITSKEVADRTDAEIEKNNRIESLLVRDYTPSSGTAFNTSATRDEKLDWVKKNTAINSALIGDQNAGGDWKSGWKILANGGKKDPKEHIPANDLPVLF